MQSTHQSPRWSSTTKALVSVGLSLLLIYLLGRFSDLVTLLIAASILAFILSPLVNRLERRIRDQRWLASLIVYFILICLLAIVPAIVIPILVDRLIGLVNTFEQILETVENLLSQTFVLGRFSIDGAEVFAQVFTTVQRLVESLFGTTFDLAVDLINSVVSGVFVLVISFYLVKDQEKVRRWLASLPPKPYRSEVEEIVQEIHLIWSSFFRGQLILALVVGTGFTLMGYAIGLPFALAMGLLAGFLEFIPSIGHTIWLTIAAFLTLFQGSTWLAIPNWAMFLLVVGLQTIFIQVDLNFLIPRIIGRRVQLHPLVIILGIIAGGSVAGVLGVVLAAPMIATARLIGRYINSKLFDEEPRIHEET